MSFYLELEALLILVHLVDLSLNVSCEPEPFDFGVITGLHDPIENNVFALALLEYTFYKN